MNRKLLPKSGLAVVTTNRAELFYMISLCQDTGQGTPFVIIHNEVMPPFPFMVCIHREGLAGWISRMDRAMDYLDFAGFVCWVAANES